MHREKFNWTVQLGHFDGSTTTQEVSSFWGPEKEGTKEAIGTAAVVEAWVDAGKPTKSANEFSHPIKVELNVKETPVTGRMRFNPREEGNI